MADDRNTGDLLIKVGLDLNAVDKGLVYLNRKLTENIKALEEKLKQEQSKLNIEGQSAKNQDEYLDQRYHRLNQILKVQQQLANLYAAENKSSGDPKALTAKLKIDEQMAALKKELEETTNILKMLKRLDVAEKGHKAQSLAEAMREGRSAYRDNSKWGREPNFKDNASAKIEKLTNAFNDLKAASGSVSGVISKTLEIVGKIPDKFGVAGKAVAAVGIALVGIPLAAKKIQDSLLELADPAMKAGDALYAASKGAQMTISEFATFSRVCKVTGIDIGEVTNMSKKLQAALIKVESGIGGAGAANAKFLVNTLKSYGVEIRKTNGELKNAYELSISLSDGLRRAQEQGRGRDFVTAIGASGDYATYLEDLLGNIELEEKIVKNRLSDPKLAHSAQGELNALNVQAEQLKGAFSSAFLPVANEMIPKIREQLGSLTSVIADNAEGIRAVASAVGDVALKVSDLTTEIIKLTAEAVNATGKVLLPDRAGDLVKKYWYKVDEIKNAEDLLRADLDGVPENVIQTIKANDGAFKIYLKAIEKIEKKRADDFAKWASFAGNEDELEFKQPAITPAEQEAHLQRMLKLTEDLQKLQLQSKWGDDWYHRELEELEIWQQKSLESLESLKLHRKEYEEESAAISELGAAKREDIERRHAAEIKKINEDTQSRIKRLTQEAANNIYNATHSAFERELRDIAQWQQAQLEKAKTAKEVQAIIENAAVKEAAAFKNELDRIKGEILSLKEKIFAQEHSQRDIDIYNTQKERARLLAAGNPADLVDRWYKNELIKIWERAKESTDYSKSPNRGNKGTGGIEIIYGDQEDYPNFDFNEGKINIQYGDIETADLPTTNFYDELQADVKNQLEKIDGDLSDAAEKAAQALSQIETDPLIKQLENFGLSVDDTTAILKRAAENLSGIETPQNAPVQSAWTPPPPRLTEPSTANSAPGIPAADSSSPAYSGGDLTVALQQIYQTQEQYLPQIITAMQPLNQMTQQLVSLSQTAGAIAQTVSAFSQRQPPNVTISPTINIDLGGAYVFDDAMKARLTDDITAEVTSAITDAVNKGVNRQNYGYGN